MNQQQTSLVLRTCAPDMSSSYGFVWPGVGEVAEASDWNPNPECGSGLHGWLYGHGDCTFRYGKAECFKLIAGAKWIVVEVESDQVVDLGGKCKFPRGRVRFVGEMKDAANYLFENEARARDDAVIGAHLRVGDHRHVAVGGCGAAIAGMCGTAVAGYRGASISGDFGTSIAGAYGTATSGRAGKAIAGSEGTARSGDFGTAISGYQGTAIAAEDGIAVAGRFGTAAAGRNGEIRIEYFDEVAGRHRVKVGYVGEDGIDPNVAYSLDLEYRFVRAPR
ncbi:DUF7666 domain-containing protein [Paraburkholderia caribensis]|uniref:DUF7666 domain-containing protein n=1 Tax=Paraburkholderia caribensis TaxID=75105 RepID=UPI001CB342B2|nr:DUF4774 domain-containing protein [Paraburkholderia caribensis]CAG9262143.1 conserved hypothetical protein [Paraburkholderia caribensis]